MNTPTHGLALSAPAGRRRPANRTPPRAIRCAPLWRA
jgi:hypothetical protein